MPQHLGKHSPRLEAVRELLTAKGRRERGRFTIEGLTLLEEARRSGVALEEIYVSESALRERPELMGWDQTAGLSVVDDRSFARLSDLETPPGVLAVAPIAFTPLPALLAEEGLVLLLAGISDPGNAGTLIRSAEAFGVGRIIFGAGGVEPHHPKVVRGAMGSLFRARIARAEVAEVAEVALSLGWEATGLAAGGTPLDRAAFPPRCLLAVGQERAGLGPWDALCTQRVGIPMASSAESLNAAVAGSIALYAASRSGRQPPG
ncbi:MAG: RNA methyltransferase [Candidatus Eremiobacteraeota bacterium]|nr:RNA methyltransferase [Candidatus Eremiobacteraeota bacterium]